MRSARTGWRSLNCGSTAKAWWETRSAGPTSSTEFCWGCCRSESRRKMSMSWFLLLTLLIEPRPAIRATTRIKELATVEGVRDTQLIGYGLVVGLAGTGDRRQTVFSAQSLANMLERMGISVPATSLRVANMAAVIVTATLPPFAQPGVRLDVTAASAGDASNLQGGLLLLTPLKGPDGQVYAVAQGPVVTGGFSAGRGGNSQTVNHHTVGRIA